jgi:hypothetical protein
MDEMAVDLMPVSLDRQGQTLRSFGLSHECPSDNALSFSQTQHPSYPHFFDGEEA